MKTLVGMNVIESKKGGKYLLLHLLEDTFFDSMKHEDLFESDAKTSWGQSVLQEFINVEDVAYGRIDVVGKMVPGCNIRIFKENVDGMDKVTLIQVLDKKK